MNRPVTPALTADVIIELTDRKGSPFVLIERKYPPPGWAIPGGFVDIGETLEHAAVREAQEETGLDVSLKVLLGMYSDPTRDFRGHTVTAVYIATANGEPVAMDDAMHAGIFTFNDLPELAFDHASILQDYLRYTKTGEVKKL
ncbi:MAG TPA: NUDIX hydrolase [Gammaproteobacteria bacterium]|nr:NUDIX hydrolase [Gammaproteobacteria bacterium]